MLEASMFLKQGARIISFVRPWLTMTNKESYPKEGRRSGIRLIESCLNKRRIEKGMEDSSR